MEECIIRKASKTDISNIMEFIDRYWKKDHILAVSHAFFEYQHVWNDEVCFIVAEDPKTNNLEGILGYIVYSEKKKRDIFGAIWKVRSNKYPMLGMKMQLFALKETNARTFSAVALNPTTLSMHKRWGAFLGKLNHFYILGNHEEFHIASIKNKLLRGYNINKEQYKLDKIINKEQLCLLCEREEKSQKVPIKSFEFIRHRYFNHPVYVYVIYGIFDKLGCLKSAIVSREIEINNRKILRIIDYIGETQYIENIGSALQQLLKEHQYEYLDFYEYGIEESILYDAGFVLREEEDINIIPNYFEPFMKKNINIDFYTSEKTGRVVIFKGDGDQDRPNFMK